jgi:hypothetical protein
VLCRGKTKEEDANAYFSCVDPPLWVVAVS